MIGSDRFSLNIGETMTSHMFDYNPQGKDFLLIKRPNEMLLLINDKNSMVLDSISFVKRIRPMKYRRFAFLLFS